jgi:RNA polymerase sigma-70 factor (ECF subfamily)
MAEKTDQEILLMLQNPALRDKGFTLLMDRHKERIYWYIRRLVVFHEDAEDVLQETFINAYRYAGSFNGKSKIYTWLYKIATNECVALFRKSKKDELKMVEISQQLENQLSDSGTETSDAILVKFQEAIQQLPEKQRIVFNLRYYDDLSYEEMEEITGSSVGTLKTNYHYATEKVKNYLKNS